MGLLDDMTIMFGKGMNTVDKKTQAIRAQADLARVNQEIESAYAELGHIVLQGEAGNASFVHAYAAPVEKVRGLEEQAATLTQRIAELSVREEAVPVAPVQATPGVAAPTQPYVPMEACPACGQPMPISTPFCSSCGGSLASVRERYTQCPSCHEYYSADTVFCMACGSKVEPLVAPAAAPAAVQAPASATAVVTEPVSEQPVAREGATGLAAEDAPAAETSSASVVEPMSEPAAESEAAPADDSVVEPASVSVEAPAPEPAPTPEPMTEPVAAPEPAPVPEPVADPVLVAAPETVPTADSVAALVSEPAPAVEPESAVPSEPVAEPEPALPANGPRFCMACGTPTNPGDVFCGSCGARLSM